MVNRRSDAARLYEKPLTEYIVRALNSGAKRTLLAICPNSEAVLKASFLAAKRANAPLAFAATLNQVDLDGGYTGWTQERFVELVEHYRDELDYSGPVIVGLDHGGPWLKDIQAREGWPLEDCVRALESSLEAALFAGYDLLHIDPTVDKTLAAGVLISIDTVIERTVRLIIHVERTRRRNHLPAVSYEVGTEEVHGGLADLAVFRRFLEGLGTCLARQGYADVWPVFVVGKVGTDLHTNTFDPETARQLVQIAGEHGSWIKGHYTDFVSDPAAYPQAGIGAANVGPEFTMAEYEALMELADEETALRKQGKIETASDFRQVLAQAVIDNGRWQKWRLPGEENLPFEQLSPDRKEWLMQTSCRYIWTDPEIRAARSRLYANLSRCGTDGEGRVLERIAGSIMHYYDTFNLVGANDVLKMQRADEEKE